MVPSTEVISWPYLNRTGGGSGSGSGKRSSPGSANQTRKEAGFQAHDWGLEMAEAEVAQSLKAWLQRLLAVYYWRSSL